MKRLLWIALLGIALAGALRNAPADYLADLFDSPAMRRAAAEMEALRADLRAINESDRPDHIAAEVYRCYEGLGKDLIVQVGQCMNRKICRDEEFYAACFENCSRGKPLINTNRSHCKRRLESAGEQVGMNPDDVYDASEKGTKAAFQAAGAELKIWLIEQR